MGNEEPQADGPVSGVVLLNPSSGASRGTKDPEQLARWAARYGTRLRISEFPGQLVQLARQEVERGCPLVIAAGGDDTVREVLHGLDRAGVFDRPFEARPHFGILPYGTFNNFARYLGVPLDIETALKAAHQGETVRVDLGRAHGILFTESVGVGIDVAAWKAFPKESPSVFRRLWDGALAVLKAITVHRPRRYFLEVDGQFRQVRAYSITVANGSYFSASVAIAPHAVRDDGLLDLCIIPSLSKWMFFFSLPLIILGKHTLYLRGVRYQKVSRVRIWAEHRALLRVDGALRLNLPVEIEVLPQALPIRLPE